MRSSVAKCFPEALEVRAPLMPSLPNMPTIRIRRSSATCDCFSDPVVDQFAAIDLCICTLMHNDADIYDW